MILHTHIFCPPNFQYIISRLNLVPFLILQNDLAVYLYTFRADMCMVYCVCLSFLQMMDIVRAAALGSLQVVCDALEAGVPVDTTAKVCYVCVSLTSTSCV